MLSGRSQHVSSVASALSIASAKPRRPFVMLPTCTCTPHVLFTYTLKRLHMAASARRMSFALASAMSTTGEKLAV